MRLNSKNFVLLKFSVVRVGFHTTANQKLFGVHCDLIDKRPSYRRRTTA